VTPSQPHHYLADRYGMKALKLFAIIVTLSTCESRRAEGFSLVSTNSSASIRDRTSDQGLVAQVYGDEILPLAAWSG